MNFLETYWPMLLMLLIAGTSLYFVNKFISDKTHKNSAAEKTSFPETKNVEKVA